MRVDLVAQSEWTREAESWFSRVEQDATLEDMRQQYEIEGAVLLHVVAAGETVGAVLLKLDCTTSGIPHGVILCASASLRGRDLTAEVLPVVEGCFRGVRSIRIHTARPGLVRKLMKQGYQPKEMVLTKGV